MIYNEQNSIEKMENIETQNGLQKRSHLTDSGININEITDDSTNKSSSSSLQDVESLNESYKVKNFNNLNNLQKCEEQNNIKNVQNNFNNENIYNINNSQKVTLEDSNSMNSDENLSNKSTESQNMYMNSLQDNDSYILSSDSELDEYVPKSPRKNFGKINDTSNKNVLEDFKIIKQEINGVMSPQGFLDKNIVNTIDNGTPLNINNLSIGGNTSDVTIGNRYNIEGNLVVKQIVIGKGNKTDNSSFEHDGPNDIQRKNKSNFSKSQENQNLTFLEKIKYKLKSKRILMIICIISILFGCVVSIIGWQVNDNANVNSYYYTSKPGDGDDKRKNIPPNSSISDTYIPPTGIFRLITRSEWLAQPPNEELVNLQLPVHRVIIAHTATEPCDTQAVCTFRVRFIQTFHIESRGFDDIGYNYLVGGDGAIYEGRGWEKVGAHTKGYNVDSICIAFIGTFNTIVPPESQMNAAKLVIDEGLKLGKISPDYKLYGHRQLIASESPGATLFRILQKWPHFATEIQSIQPLKDPKKSEDESNKAELES